MHIGMAAGRLILLTMRMTPTERETLGRLTKHRKMRHCSELIRQLLLEEEHHQARLDDELRERHKSASARRTVRP
jgi:hypothetical protein